MLQGRTPLIIASVFAILAGLAAFFLVRGERNDIQRGWEPVAVVVAARDLAPGDVLTRENLALGELPAKAVTRSVVTAKDVSSSPVIGLKLAVPMLHGDVLLYSHVHSTSTDQQLSQAIQTRGRAVSIRVTPESSVHNWIEPGDRVDVIGVFRDPKTRDSVATTMLQNVIVIATGRVGGRTNRRLLTEAERTYSTVTLHVLPEAAEMLVLGQELGTFHLTLRSPEDNEIYDLGDGRTTIGTLLTGERSKEISRTQSKIFKVEIIRGKNSEMQTVP
ncbi:MAG: Flp pilus assembly protein CpaB [Clostridia bacterium]|nr:Flp pilus assembly protein CpaB [Deltaproteobacteria bacterium]